MILFVLPVECRPAAQVTTSYATLNGSVTIGTDGVVRSNVWVTTSDMTCSEHGRPLIWEPGGVDKPTIHGRWYCSECQEKFITALDGLS